MSEHHDPHEPDEPDGYQGAGVAMVDGNEYKVELALSGHFEPISGGYVWYGRVRGLPGTQNGTVLLLRVPEDGDELAEGRATVTERDLWGHHMVSGVGAPPFRAFDTSVL